jgi:hypothetical protein
MYTKINPEIIISWIENPKEVSRLIRKLKYVIKHICK